MFCGDGINDLAALSAADIGMAIGADAVIAAELSTSNASVAGQLSAASLHETLLASTATPCTLACSSKQGLIQVEWHTSEGRRQYSVYVQGLCLHAGVANFIRVSKGAWTMLIALFKVWMLLIAFTVAVCIYYV